jgi:hypothetical protein
MRNKDRSLSLILIFSIESEWSLLSITVILCIKNCFHWLDNEKKDQKLSFADSSIIWQTEWWNQSTVFYYFSLSNEKFVLT